MYRKKSKYEVLNYENDVILSGDVLSELIATTILETFKHLENDKSLLHKINKNYFSFYNVLADVYKNSEYLLWDNIKAIEIIHNNQKYLHESKFIKFKRNTWTLTKAELKIDLNFHKKVSWKLNKEKD
ncbi:hypothetical protein NGB25_12960 [Staphylococcus saprophyticus]|uniref:hypothetical protein n=1 Tax=Staphylococcus saprophyticus TaxID=29385 RepID=UPI002DBCC11C|nr:hypothetical protein [Staphylococcus saprophyticus]MEB7678011.1 hypothetical protein [Staphylococcus saprophyticus]